MPAPRPPYSSTHYLLFQIWNAVRSELGWTHYRIFMREKDPIAREWYINECVTVVGVRVIY